MLGIGIETSIASAEEVANAIKDREVMLADIKKRRDEYNAQKKSNNSVMSPSQPAVAKQGTFNF